MNRRSFLKRALCVLPSIFIPKIVFASRPLLSSLNNHSLSKQSFQLDQIIPEASKQEYENLTVYSTVGQVSEQTIIRWSKIWDLWVEIFVNMDWWFIDQIPKQFKVVLVSEAEYAKLWPLIDSTALYNYPDEVWSKGFTTYDTVIIHELLHRVLSWIYVRNSSAFPDTRLPGYSPFIINGAEYAVSKLTGERDDPMVIDQDRFNQLWTIAKQIMAGQGFVGTEEIPAPIIINAVSGIQRNQVSRILYERWEKHNGTGEIYLGIIMFSAILDHYNLHRDYTGIFSLAVCNAKIRLNQKIGSNSGENFFTIFQGQVINCE